MQRYKYTGRYTHTQILPSYNRAVLGLAYADCRFCNGAGERSAKGTPRICDCVYRRIASSVAATYRVFEYLVARDYRIVEWRADVDLVRRANAGNVPVTWDPALGKAYLVHGVYPLSKYWTRSC